jgi:hypothetical protein
MNPFICCGSVINLKHKRKRIVDYKLQPPISCSGDETPDVQPQKIEDELSINYDLLFDPKKRTPKIAQRPMYKVDLRGSSGSQRKD